MKRFGSNELVRCFRAKRFTPIQRGGPERHSSMKRFGLVDKKGALHSKKEPATKRFGFELVPRGSASGLKSRL